MTRLATWTATVLLALATTTGGALAQAEADDESQAQVERDAEGNIVFRHALDDEPIELDMRSSQEITPQVEEFHQTGENPYSGDEEAIAAGKKTYGQICAACHLPDGTGRIGPSLIDGTSKHPRVGTDIGNFEIIYAGGAGAMQAFGQRIDQDQILKVMAYLETLEEE